MRRILPFYLLTLSLITGILVPTLVRDGMFVDGVVYSAVSKNLAHGIGSWFSPQFSSSAGSVFFEHPPLGFILQSAFFKVIGDSIYTERFYSFFMAILSAWGIIFCLQNIDDHKYRNIYWLPVLLWILTPTISWVYKNNMLENTVTVFVLFAAGFSFKAVKQKSYLLLILSAFLIFLSFLIKGFVGIFPVVIPAIYALLFEPGKRISIALKFSILLTLFSASFLFLTFLIFPDLQSNITHYLQQQLIPALQDKREITTHNHFNIMLLLLKELIIPAGIVFILFISTYLTGKTKKEIKVQWKIFTIFLAIALCGSLPLVITLKQRAFYLVPSIPFYVLAFTMIVANPLTFLIESLSNKAILVLKIAGYASVFGSLIFSATFAGQYSRDEILLQDVHKICNLIPHNQTITLISAGDNFWILNAYLSRNGNISVDPEHQRKYLLTDKGVFKNKIDSSYVPLNSNLNNYVIFMKNFQSSEEISPY